MESCQSKVLSFKHYEQNRSFPIAFAIKKEEKEEKLFSNSFKIGKGSREISFSSEGLKHFHILDCSPRNIDLNDLNVDERLFQELIGELKPELIIKIKPKNGKKNHPKGIYKLPNKVILKFIEEKRKSYN